MRHKDFISIHDLTVDEVHQIFELTKEMKSNPKKFPKSLEGKILALIFEKTFLENKG